MCVALGLYSLSAIDGSCALTKKELLCIVTHVEEEVTMGIQRSLQLLSHGRHVVGQWLSWHLRDGDHSRSEYVD